MSGLEIHPHALIHGLSEENVRYAWENYVRKRCRHAPNEDQIVAIGSDESGRLIQMVGVVNSQGTLVYHALTPPTSKALRELGLLRRKR